jgi:hypothetical protein
MSDTGPDDLRVARAAELSRDQQDLPPLLLHLGDPPPARGRPALLAASADGTGRCGTVTIRWCWPRSALSHSEALELARATPGTPEELQLDVVWVAEREHGIRGVRRLLDPGVWHPELVQSGGPVIKVAALGNQELEVIEPRLELVEGTGLAAMVNQAQLDTGMRPAKADELDVPIRPGVTAGFYRAENLAVPCRAALGVPDRQYHDLPDDVWHRPRVTPRWRGCLGIRSSRDH